MLQSKLKNILVLFCIVFTSCDSFLTTPPLDKIEDSQWWKTKSEVEMMVDRCYAFIYDVNDVVYRDCFTDNAKYRNGSIPAIGNGTHDTSNASVSGEWKYSSIAHLNYTLEGLEKSKRFISEDNYKQWSAQIRFIRAFIYYDMVFYFGDIPLITKVLTVSESKQTFRQPRAEVLNFILKELEEGVLNDIKVNPSAESGRVNIDVVNSFLARIYLHEKNYDKVLYYTNEVIKSKHYELYADYDELFRPNSDGVNKEVIFERQYVMQLYMHSLNRDLSPTSSIYAGWSQALPLQSMVDEYECINGHAYHDCEALGCEFFIKRQGLESTSKRGEYEFRDPRLHATIMYPFWEWKVGNIVKSVYGVDNPASKDYIKSETHHSGFLVTKWVDMKGENADRTRAHKNLTIIRYADILLMKAEALIEKNQDLGEVASLLNSIRKRAGIPENITVTSQSDMRTKVRHERRVELALEGLRYYDIIRWRIARDVKSGNAYGARLKALTGTLENMLVEKRFWEDKMYLFPIPQSARDVNPNLTQNEGW